jgi:hypothetical protein
MHKNTKEELLQKYVSQEHELKILEEIHAVVVATMSLRAHGLVRLSEQVLLAFSCRRCREAGLSL